MQTNPKLSRTALMVGAAAVALCRRSIDAGAWRALAVPPACLPAARDSVDARVPSFAIASANLAGRRLMHGMRGLAFCAWPRCSVLRRLQVPRVPLEQQARPLRLKSGRGYHGTASVIITPPYVYYFGELQVWGFRLGEYALECIRVYT